jgi:hypothetical protein
MKKLMLFLMAVAAFAQFNVGMLGPGFARGTPASTPITHVSTQSAGDATAAPVATLSTSATSHTTGNALAVLIRYNGGVGSPSVTNTASDSWSSCAGSSFGGDASRWFYALSSNGNASDVVTLTPPSGAAYVSLIVFEFANVASASALDVCQGNSGTGTSITSASFTTTTANQVLLHGAVWDNDGRSLTPGSGYTGQTDPTGISGAEYKIVTGVQTSVTAAMSINTSQGWASTTISLKGN